MKRLDCLDGLRGVLALYVLLTHMAPFATLPPALAWLLSHGEAAVDVFFILSGLVITASIEHFEYRAAPFLLARATRILPVFLPVFAFAVLVQPLPLDFPAMPWIGPDSAARHIWSEGWPDTWATQITLHLAMLHGVFPRAILPDLWVSFLGAAWSLSTEWQFYVLVALVGPALGRGQRGLWRMTALLLVLGALGAIWQDIAVPDWTFSRAFLPNKSPYFALGVASGALLRGPTAWRPFLGALVAVIALCLLHDNTLKALVPPIWVICLLAQMVHPGRGARALVPLRVLLDHPWSRWLGGVSYSLYLVNEPIQKVLGVALASAAGGDAALFTFLWLPAAVLLPLLVAWWLRVTIEVPALRYGRALARALLDRGKPWVVAPVAGWDPLAPARPVPPPGRVPMGVRAVMPDPAPNPMANQHVQPGHAVVMRPAQDPDIPREHATRTRVLCARYCPYRAGGQDNACAALPEACATWLAQQGLLPPPDSDAPPAGASRPLSA